ncbi:unnamed protein product [Symbiodinium natans]|uniref:Uncharacterized protein n=1 Tax=Symbiodinium natans TaxID=878477 RepID=A0A812PM93_9DINO|nr:unnamed protein product [Symbiodinium natans]
MGCAAGIPTHPHNAQIQRPGDTDQMAMKVSMKMKLAELARHGPKLPKPQHTPQPAVESSWDSATWAQDIPRDVPRPPNRISHERHLKLMDLFRKEIEVAPDAFSDIISSHRQTM